MTTTTTTTTAAASRDWTVWTTTARLVVTDAAMLDRASSIADEITDRVAAACDRFSTESELSRLADRLPEGVVVSEMLALLVGSALDAAEMSAGDVDPTLGAELADLGLAAGDDTPWDTAEPEAGTLTEGVTLATGRHRGDVWRQVRLRGRLLTVPAGVRLDLGATAKAVAADLIAARVHTELGCGVLVSLGGDIATAGPGTAARPGTTAGPGTAARPGTAAGPASRAWEITVRDLPADPEAQVAIPSGHAVATSSTQKRRWVSGGRPVHHILDPRWGVPAAPVWRSVSVAAPSCLVANTFSTAAVVRGLRAVPWLREHGVSARLVDSRGRVVTTGAWPAEPAAAPTAAR